MDLVMRGEYPGKDVLAKNAIHISLKAEILRKLPPACFPREIKPSLCVFDKDNLCTFSCRHIEGLQLQRSTALRIQDV